MNRTATNRPWPGLLLVALSPVVHAQPSHPCATVVNDRDRLACYDTAFARAPADDPQTTSVAAAPTPVAAAPGPVAAASAPVAAAGTTAATAAAAVNSPVAAASNVPSSAPTAGGTPEHEFGLSEAQRRERTPEKVTVPAEPQSIESTATMVSSRRTGEFVYTLANGQVWIQSEASSAGYIADGSAVTIKRAALGSFKLVSGKVSTRVRRVQ